MSDWQPIETAPKTGERLLLWVKRNYAGSRGEAQFGSWRVDSGYSDNEDPLWLDESYDEFSCGYVSVPLSPTHWQPAPTGPEGGL